MQNERQIARIIFVLLSTHKKAQVTKGDYKSKHTVWLTELNR